MELSRPGGDRRLAGRVRRPDAAAGHLPAGRRARQPGRRTRCSRAGSSAATGCCMFCENSVEAYLAKFGIAKAGLACVPLNPMLAPGRGRLPARRSPSRASRSSTPSCGPSRPASFAARADHARRDDRDRRRAGRGQRARSPSFVAGASTDRARRRDPRRRRLADHLHLGHHRDAQGRDGHPQLQLPGRLLVRAHADAQRAPRVRSAAVHVPAADLPHRRPDLHALPAFLSGGTLVMGRGYDPARSPQTLDEERITALWGGSPAMLTDLADELEARPRRSTSSALRHADLRLDRGGARARRPR